jgi:hypothetical protein
VIRGTALVALLLLSACKPPKYALYTSLDRDYSANVPFAWEVLTDSEGLEAFRHANFIGPYSAEFFRGAPSFSIRWYGNRKIRTLPNGGVESYADADDFISRTIRNVYGPEHSLYWQPTEAKPGGEPCGKNLKTCLLEAKVGANKDLPAKIFLIVSPLEVQLNHIGAAEDEKGRQINPRKHEYVVLPREKGFYVLTYPATVAGYPKYKKQFNQLVNSFRLMKEGPLGQAAAHGTALPVKKP